MDQLTYCIQMQLRGFTDLARFWLKVNRIRKLSAYMAGGRFEVNQ